MPEPKSPEVRQRAVELARLREKPIAKIEKICTSASRVCAPGWTRPAWTTATNPV
jgi:transposase